MENGLKGCINRDYNDCLNMSKIYFHYMVTGERPFNYRRGTKQNKVTSEMKSNISQPLGAGSIAGALFV